MLRVERDVEARLRGLRRASELRFPVGELTLDLGDLPLYEAVWALSAADGSLRAFAEAKVLVRGQGDAARLYRGLFAARDSSPFAPAGKLTIDLSQPGASRARLLHEQDRYRLRVPGNPKIHPGQHRAGDWFDGALCAGLPALNEAPRLPLTLGSRHAGATLLLRAIESSWRAVVAWIPSSHQACEIVRDAASQTARWLGGLVLQVGGEAQRTPFLDRTREDICTLAAALACCAVCVTDDEGWAQVAAAAGAPVVQASRGLDTWRCGPASPLGAAVGGVSSVQELASLARRDSVLGFPGDRLRRWL